MLKYFLQGETLDKNLISKKSLPLNLPNIAVAAAYSHSKILQ
jgi:hypothetical protein